MRFSFFAKFVHYSLLFSLNERSNIMNARTRYTIIFLHFQIYFTCLVNFIAVNLYYENET